MVLAQQLVLGLMIGGLYGLAATGLSWWLGLALAPTIGAQLLGVSPAAALLAAAGAAAAAAVSALVLERELPSATRLTPRPAVPS